MNDPLLCKYLTAMKEVIKVEEKGINKLPEGMYGKLCNKYVHYFANYNGLSSVGLKGGEHILIASVAYLNQPVAMSKDENGNISFNRGEY